MITQDWHPNLIWRVKTYLRNRRWASYWNWEQRDNDEHVAIIESYKPLFAVDDPPGGDDPKVCKFCGRAGSRSFIAAGRGTWRCSTIKACVARSKRGVA